MTSTRNILTPRLRDETRPGEVMGPVVRAQTGRREGGRPSLGASRGSLSRLALRTLEAEIRECSSKWHRVISTHTSEERYLRAALAVARVRFADGGRKLTKGRG